MSVIGSNILAGASGQGGAYNLTNSLRFRSSASAYLSRTPASTTNQKTWTFSAWVKRGALANGVLFGTETVSAQTYCTIYYVSDKIYLDAAASNVETMRVYTNAVFRDPSAWYHVVVYLDTTQATAANRTAIYINGVSQTLTVSTNPAQDLQPLINSTVAHNIGRNPINGIYLDGYLTELNFIDGQALTPSSFGETSATTGVWIPKKYTGTYGTNGFYLPFTDNSALTTSSNVGLGKDFSGNSNYWTTNNISITSGSTYDSMTDVPTLTSATASNYSVLNPLDIPSNVSVSKGNLEASMSSNAVWKTICNTISVSSGKWYAEFSINESTSMIGIIRSSWNANIADSRFWADSLGYSYYGDNGQKYNNNASTSYGATYTTNDIIGVALDLDNGTLTFYKNNTSQGTAFTGLTGEFKFAVAMYANTQVAIANFGQRPFTYTPPTGFLQLNTFNLPTPTIGATASTTANKYFNANLYTGNGTTNAITNVGFQPDFVWVKSRSDAYFHGLYDAVRGAGSTKGLYSNDTVAEGTYSDFQNLVSFDSNGFTLGATSNTNNINANTSTFVGWNWKANGAGSTNTAGSITSTVSANTSAGFSIVTYTGTGSASDTVGHGLGVTPAMVITKRRSSGSGAFNWMVKHSSLASNHNLLLESTGASTDVTSGFGSGGIANLSSSTTFGFLNGTSSNPNNANTSGATYVAYCFAPVAGYSAFGSYTGNGSSDGTFVYTGFRPRWIMIKNISRVVSWYVEDSARDTYNVMGLDLNPNLSNAEGNDTPVLDFLSNGFKMRNTYDAFNQSGETIIYACFAESPFKYANAR